MRRSIATVTAFAAAGAYALYQRASDAVFGATPFHTLDQRTAKLRQVLVVFR
jgi:hypothetical protein